MCTFWWRVEVYQLNFGYRPKTKFHFHSMYSIEIVIIVNNIYRWTLHSAYAFMLMRYERKLIKHRDAKWVLLIKRNGSEIGRYVPDSWNNEREPLTKNSWQCFHHKLENTSIWILISLRNRKYIARFRRNWKQPENKEPCTIHIKLGIYPTQHVFVEKVEPIKYKYWVHTLAHSHRHSKHKYKIFIMVSIRSLSLARLFTVWFCCGMKQAFDFDFFLVLIFHP